MLFSSGAQSPSRDTLAACTVNGLVIYSSDFDSHSNDVMAVLVEVISFLQEHWIQERSLYFYHLQTPNDPVKEKNPSDQKLLSAKDMNTISRGQLMRFT